MNQAHKLTKNQIAVIERYIWEDICRGGGDKNTVAALTQKIARFVNKCNKFGAYNTEIYQG